MLIVEQIRKRILDDTGDAVSFYQLEALYNYNIVSLSYRGDGYGKTATLDTLDEQITKLLEEVSIEANLKSSIKGISKVRVITTEVNGNIVSTIYISYITEEVLL